MSKLSNIALRKIAKTDDSEIRDPNKKYEGHWIPGYPTKQVEIPGLFTEKGLQEAVAEAKKREKEKMLRNKKLNEDAAWSYGGATVGGGALGALLGGEGNRLKSAIIGALLANAANFGRRKWKYGKDVIA